MTHENNQGAENLNWMEIAESDAMNDVRHSSRRLPFIAAAVSLLIIGGGAVFAQTSNETPAQAEEISVTQTSQTSSTVSDPAVSSPSAAVPSVGGSTMTPGGIPVIPNVAPGVGGYDDEDDDDDYEDDDDHEDDDHDEDEDDD